MPQTGSLTLSALSAAGVRCPLRAGPAPAEKRAAKGPVEASSVGIDIGSPRRRVHCKAAKSSSPPAAEGYSFESHLFNPLELFRFTSTFDSAELNRSGAAMKSLREPEAAPQAAPARLLVVEDDPLASVLQSPRRFGTWARASSKPRPPTKRGSI